MHSNKLIILASNPSWNPLSLLHMCKNLIGFNAQLNEMHKLKY